MQLTVFLYVNTTISIKILIGMHFGNRFLRTLVVGLIVFTFVVQLYNVQLALQLLNWGQVSPQCVHTIHMSAFAVLLGYNYSAIYYFSGSSVVSQ